MLFRSLVEIWVGLLAHAHTIFSFVVIILSNGVVSLFCIIESILEPLDENSLAISSIDAKRRIVLRVTQESAHVFFFQFSL